MRWPGALGLAAKRPRLMLALAIGLACGFGAHVLQPDLRASTCAILGWDGLCLAFMVIVSQAMWRSSPEEIRARAAQEDEGRGAILALVLAGSAASLGAIGVELTLAKAAQGLERAPHIALAFGTVAASWAMVQLVFALHYAHEYYSALPDAGGDAEGLAFPGERAPDYWDFVHFATVIGVACQTADIAFTARGLRRLGTIHGVVAFAFNTLVVALTINLLAGLF